MFENIEKAPPDAILGLTDAFKADVNPAKVNLGVGVYKDTAGRTPILDSVKIAETRILESETSKSYLPISGSPVYAKLVQGLLFGKDHPVIKDGRAQTCHTPGGTGGLRVGADFIHLMRPEATIWVSSPTWANHKAIFGSAGIPVKEYAYYDAASHGLDREGLMSSLENVPAGDVVLLHVCCHNPTGVDLELEDWKAVASLAAAKGWTPFFDFAYQGFGDGVDEDRAALAPFVDAGIECFIANSFSKNFGLYNERTGGLTIVAATPEDAEAAFSHVMRCIRTNYSNPSSHGGSIVETILSDEALAAQWDGELAAMRKRIKDLRGSLVKGLSSRGIEQDFSYIETQRGMFSFSGLTDAQVAWLRSEKSIYIVGGGRINVAGITPDNLDYLCDSLAESLRTV